MRVVIRKGAGVNTVTVDAHEFDLNKMPAAVYHKFRRELVDGLTRLGKVRA